MADSFTWRGPYRMAGTVPMAEIIKLCGTGRRRTFHLPDGDKVRITDLPKKELFRISLSQGGTRIQEFIISAGSIVVMSRNNGTVELPWTLLQYMSYEDVGIGVPETNPSPEPS